MWALAALLVLVSGTSQAQTVARWVPFSVSPQTSPIDRIHLQADGVDVVSLPATWYDCRLGCAHASARVYAASTAELRIVIERGGVRLPPSDTIPARVFRTTTQQVSLGAQDVNEDCRVDAMDDLLRRLNQEGRLP